MHTIQKMGHGYVSDGYEMQETRRIRFRQLIRFKNPDCQLPAVSHSLVVQHVETFQIFTKDVDLVLRVDFSATGKIHSGGSSYLPFTRPVVASTGVFLVADRKPRVDVMPSCSRAA